MIKPISFGYRSVLKTQWLKGNMPEVERGFYGGILTRENVTLEHIKPHSKGGKTTLNNLALAVNTNNWNRANKPLILFFDREVFDEYCEQFRGIRLFDFDGDKYVRNLKKTVERLISNEH